MTTVRPTKDVIRALALDVHRVHRLLAACRTSVGRRGLRHGVLPGLVPQTMLRRLQPNFILDVGANRGQFTLDALIAAPGAEIHAVEPLEEPYRTLSRVTRRCTRVRLSQCALGSRIGTATLFVAAADDSSSLLPIGALQQSIYPGTESERTVPVRVVTADYLLRDVEVPQRSLLKLDVQGYELEVLRGAATHLRHFQWVYSEVSFVRLYDGQALAAEVIDYLSLHGFGLADLSRPDRYAGRSVQVDMLFERQPTRGDQALRIDGEPG